MILVDELLRQCARIGKLPKKERKKTEGLETRFRQERGVRTKISVLQYAILSPLSYFFPNISIYNWQRAVEKRGKS